MRDSDSMTTKPKLTAHAKRFITIHGAASSLREVAEQMQMSVEAAGDYATSLRRKGIALKRFPTGRPKTHTGPITTTEPKGESQ